ncbi:MAG: FKBP-type peptidyl-prolyl cis-trans isomerase [Flavisolibacter sp.]
MKKIVFALGFISFLFSSCLKSSDSSNNNSCNYDPCATKAPASEIANVQSYLTANNITNAVQHCSGLFYSIDAPGTGKTPTVCSNIKVSYVGKFTNGNTFDSASAANPLVFNLSQTITGWKSGIPLVKAGGSLHLYIPPTLGYGSTAYGGIPANSILVFRVDLLDVQ